MDEVGAIIVRLTGDGSDFQKTMKDAQTATQKMEETIISVGNHIDGFGDQLSRWGELAVSALALNAVKRFLGDSLHAWEETENAAIKLTAVLQANGRDVDALAAHYNEFAAGVQRATKTSDDATIELLAMAESYELTGQAAKDAVKHAIAFAAINGGNAEQYLRFTQAMAEGDLERMKMMARMIPQLRGIKDETELMRKATLLAAVGWETAQKQADTFSGRMTQLKNAFGDIMEDVGKTVSEFAKPFVTVFREGVDIIQSFSFEAKQAATAILMIVAALASIGPAIAVYRATLSPLFTMMDDGFKLAAKGIVLTSQTLLSLLNPITLVKTAFIGLRLVMSGLRTVLATAFGPVGIVAGLIALVISELGGLEETWNLIRATAAGVWDVVKESTVEFLQWLKPIGRAISGVFSAAWEDFKYIVVAAWNAVRPVIYMIGEAITDVWKQVTGETKLDWEKIRNYIVDALIGAEFVLRNFEKSWQLAVTNMALYIQNNFGGITDFLTKSIAGWEMMIRQLEVVVRGVMGELTKEEVEQQTRAISVEIKDRTEFELKNREKISEQLKKDQERLAADLGQTWLDFRERRRREIFASDQDEKDGPISNMLKKDRMAAEGEIKKLQAVLIGSTESFARILAHQEMVRGGSRPVDGGSMSGASRGTDSNAQLNRNRELTLWQRIEEHLRVIRNKPGANLQPAELT